jgi:hypothetical protein
VTWQTFWLEPTGRERRALRRYTGSYQGRLYTCVDGWHQALVWTGEEVDTVWNEHGYHDLSWPAPPHDDPLWPTRCERCDHLFSAADDGDEWQTWSERLYRRVDTGELRVLHWKHSPPDAPPAEPGATWDAAWLNYKGPDGISLMVRCPRGDGSPGMNHDWPVDAPSTRSGGAWTRTGDPRRANVTVNPSIAIGTPGQPGFYHGFLRDGVLTAHLGG